MVPSTPMMSRAQPDIAGDGLVAHRRHDEQAERRERAAHGRQGKGRPDEHRVSPGLERAEAGQANDERGGSERRQDRAEVLIRRVERGPHQAGKPQGAADHGGDPSDAKRHGKPPSMFRVGAQPPQVEVGVERAEEDVGDVERAQRPLREERRELVAVPGPPAGGVEAEEEGDHGTHRPVSLAIDRAGAGRARRRPTARGAARRRWWRPARSGDTAAAGPREGAPR